VKSGLLQTADDLVVGHREQPWRDRSNGLSGFARFAGRRHEQEVGFVADVAPAGRLERIE
jgi:hypothetical protein